MTTPDEIKRLERIERIKRLKTYFRGERDGAMWAEAGTLNPIDGLHFLLRHGPAARLKEFRESGDRTLRLCPWAGLSDSEETQFQDGFRAVVERVEELYDIATMIEYDLGQLGWEFDAKTKTLRGITGAAGGRPNIFNEQVRRVFEAHHSGEKNTQSVRDQIAERLATTFHPDHNDPRSRGPIANAINTHLNPLRH